MYKILKWLAWLPLFTVGGLAVSPRDTLVIQAANSPVTLDPGGTYDNVSGAVVENIYETLVTYKGGSLRQLKPLLATKWTVSNSGKTFAFDLRKGVKFHNGDPFTCEDAEYTFRRNIITNNSNNGNWFIAESLLGTQDNAYTDKTITWSRISNAVKCNANGQLVMNLAKTDPAFLSKLAYVGQSVIDKEYAVSMGEWSGGEADWKKWVGKDLSESNITQKPNGTGAYRLIKRDKDNLLFDSFDNYWGGKPAIDKVDWQKVNEAASRVQALLKGDADVVDINSKAVAENQLRGKPGIAVVDNLPTTGVSAIFMNQKLSSKAPLGSGKLDGKGIPANFFSDINIRKAFNYAFNYDLYIRNVSLGKGEKRTMLLPNNFLGYDSTVPVYSYDPAQAKAYFQKAWDGQVWKNGFTIVAYYGANDSTSQTTMQILKQGIEALNPKFHINLQSKPWSEIWDSNLRGQLPLSMDMWVPDYADPDNFMYTFYSSDGYYEPRTNYKDTKTDQWLIAARSTFNISERERYYGRVAERAYELAPYINIPISYGSYFFSNRLKGVSASSINPVSSSTLGMNWKELGKN